MKDEIIKLEKEITEKIASFNEKSGLLINEIELVYIQNNITGDYKIVATKIKISR